MDTDWRCAKGAQSCPCLVDASPCSHVRAKPLFRSFHGFEFGFGMRLREMISRANRFCRSQSCMLPRTSSAALAL